MSKHEGRVLEHIKKLAEAQGLSFRSDATGNLVVFRPGSGAGVNAPTVILQGHVDMVCEKNSDVQHDFLEDPIELVMDGEWLKARGTTLGADNGIGVAAALAVMHFPPDADLPPIEFLFTVDEETGLTGAKALNNDELQMRGSILINMDTEDWGEICIGCAGGGDTNIELPVQRAAVPAGCVAMDVTITGLKGGHSGCNIHEYRGNAVKCIAELCGAGMMALAGESSFRLSHIDAGDKRNAIAREGRAVIVCPSEREAAVRLALRDSADWLMMSHGPLERNIHVCVNTTRVPAESLTPASSEAILKLLMSLPHGVAMMSHVMPGMVETSNNVASVKLTDSSCLVVCTTRSSLMGRLDALRQRLKVVAELCGGRVTFNQAYPGWNPAPDGLAVSTVKQIYKETFNVEPHITAIHAGLECGILNSRLGGDLDMVSFGPTIKEAHSPDEKCHVPSVASFWQLTQALLARLARTPATGSA